MATKLKLMKTGILLLAMAGAVTGCSAPTTAVKEPDQGVSAAILEGKVIETMDAGGYTYAWLEKGGKKTWVAIPATKVVVGQQLKVMGGAEMYGFSSKTLNRNFDMIVFSGGIIPDAPGATPAPSDAAAAAPASAQAPEKAPAKAPEPPVLAGKVVETMKAGNYTYILLEKDGRKGWAAIPAVEVELGEEVELVPGIDMGKFRSTVLNREFESIHFSAGCKSRVKPESALPPGHPPTGAADKKPAGSAAPAAPAAPAAQPALGEPLSGKVVETADAAGYTYICLEKNGAKTWAAVPTMKVSVGQELTLAGGVTMNKFTSKALNRTFDKIVFSGGPQK